MKYKGTVRTGAQLTLHEEAAYISDQQLEEIKSDLKTRCGLDCLSGAHTSFHQSCLKRDGKLSQAVSWLVSSKDKQSLRQETLVADVRHLACDLCLEGVTGSSALLGRG